MTSSGLRTEVHRRIHGTTRESLGQNMKHLLTVCCLLAVKIQLLAQGFLNLNFEQAITTNHVYNTISASDAFPNWTVNNVFPGYNDIALDAPAVDLFDTNYYALPAQGKYSAYLQGGSQFAYLPHTGASIMQTGQVPVTAQSIYYWGGALAGSFNGHALTFNAVGSGASYTIWQADISSFAGQTGQLMFTAPWQTAGLLDNIQFSTTPCRNPVRWPCSRCAVGS